MTKPLIILQICRRFGPVGGMERYVWEITRELSAMGHEVHVLCEVNLCTEALPSIFIHELGTVRPTPRWLAHIRFSQRIHTWLEENRVSEMIIHSHERTQDHQITTFHGPPFAKIRDFSWWKRLSLRAKMNLWLEGRELCNPQVQIIVPNSMQISQQLKHYYPTINQQLTTPIMPGVGNILQRPTRHTAPNNGTIGFVGKEWKRKGLVMAIDIVSELAKQRPNLHFMVAGCDPQEAAPLFKHVSFDFTLLGRVDTSSLYQQLDILLHPAKNEPFGMVITEALSAGVPVIISDVCGASSEVSAQHGRSLSLTSSIETWAEEMHQWLSKKNVHVQYQHSWHDTAMAYVKEYQKLKGL